MLDKIETLRKQPEHIRNRYAFWIAFAVTLCIALVWAISLPSRFSVLEEAPEEEVEVVEDVSRIGSVLANASVRIKEVIATFRSKTDNETTTASTTKKEEIDFAELIASSTQNKARNAELQGSSTASTTASTTGTVGTTTSQ